jgi:superfamily II DNA or RNA helicase/HKD family nuclease
MKLVKGVYENLINNGLEEDMKQATTDGLVCKTDSIDAAESCSILAHYLSEVVRKKLEDENSSTEEKMQFVNGILESVKASNDDKLIETNEKLSAVLSQAEDAGLTVTRREIVKPMSGFRVSNLFTGGQSDLPLNEELLRDIASADHICLIVSFLRLSGIRLIIDSLRKFCEKDGHTLRIITTTYCGATEGKAVQQLSELPNTEIRISYNTQIERLHAKSYIFERNSGLSTAYIGSSNLSKSAQTDGLEWNIRVTNVENPHIIKSALATFNIYWDSPNFEDFRMGGIDRFNEKAEQERHRGSGTLTTEYHYFTVLPHQKVILDRLQAEREANGLYRNLVVAATGTGKTVVSAFDYQNFKRSNPGHDKLLFVAHREEILKQSISTYRSILGDANFGELWVGGQRPIRAIDHLFVSVQTLNSQFNIFQQLGKDSYDYIVIDEAHHAAAESYRKIVDFFTPHILLGLTATPERMDGVSLLPDFGNKISAEIRLPRALEEGLLTPFQYFCITDPTDLSDDELWLGNKYITSKLTDKLCNKERVGLIVDRLRHYLPDECACKALCFCSDKRHAAFMADEFTAYGLKAASLTSDNDEDRTRLNRALADGKINYLFVVDMFNEGVDIPEVDVVLFLRPTDSLTIFLQQLGRGLRLSAGKQYLTVMDFVAQVNKNYDFASRFRALCLRQDKSVAEQIQNGFTLLPRGCAIFMEEKAQKSILENIKSAIYNQARLVKELRTYADCPTLGEFLKNNGQDIRLIYRGNNCWSSLKKSAGKCTYAEDSYTKIFEKGMSYFTHINSISYLKFIRKFINANCSLQPIADEKETTYSLMLYYEIFQDKISKFGFTTIYEALAKLSDYPVFVNELNEIVDYLLDNIEIKTYSIGDGLPSALEQYGCYSRDEIFAMFGRQTAVKTMHGSVLGVFNIAELNTELFFVTLNKSDKDFSPTTQYNDYVISEHKFHWQSQNSDSHKGSGQRFVLQKENKKKFLLFVREFKKDGFGNTCPFYCFGFVDYISSHGDFPMNIEWKVEQPIMAKFVKAV